MPSILFVCTANQFRSPIAAACFLQQLAGDDSAEAWRVESAGTWTKFGLPAPEIAHRVAGSLGLDGLQAHRARLIGQDLLDQFDLIIVMESSHKEGICADFRSACPRVYLLSEIVDGARYDIPDPAHPGVDAAEVGTLLCDLITRGKEKILDLAETLEKE